MLEYLYSAYSLPESEPLSKRWRTTLIDIARQEMGHFLTLQNVLRAVGGSIVVGRDQAHFAADLHPFAFSLEPFTRKSVAKYIVAEMPEHASVDLGPVISTAERGAGIARVHRVGRVYERIATLLAAFTAADMCRDNLDLQATASEWRGDPSMIGDRIEHIEDARAAIGKIALQGEGLHVDPSSPSHFERFLAIWNEWPDAYAPARPVPTNPRIGTADDRDENAITAADTVRWAELLNLRYRLLLVATTHALITPSRRPIQRGILLRTSLRAMHEIAAVAERLVLLPRNERTPVEQATAGATFDMPYGVGLPDSEAERWRQYEDILAASEMLMRDIGMEDALVKNISTADEELSALSSQLRRDPDIKRVIVIGAGPAGLAASIALARNDVPVMLINAARTPGGKVESHREDGRSYEHGVHGWWANYKNFDRLLTWCDVDPAAALQEANGSMLVDVRGRRFPLRTIALPSPLFLLAQLIRAPFLRKLDFLLAAKFFIHVLAFDHERDYEAYDPFTFADLMRYTGVPDDLRINVLEPFVLSFDFASSDRVSASAGLSGLQFYVIPDRRSVLARWATGLPDDVIFEPIVSKLRALQGELVSGMSVTSVAVTDGAVQGVRTPAVSLAPIDVALDSIPATGFTRVETTAARAVWIGRASGGIAAFDATCPHAGCAVEWSGLAFNCPCHGSSFDADGHVVHGPATTGLTSLPCQTGPTSVTVLTAGTTTILCRDVVLATDVEAAKRLLRATPNSPPALCETVDRLGTSPVIVVRLWFDAMAPIDPIESAITPEFGFIDNYFDVTRFDRTISAEGHVIEVQSYRVDRYLHSMDDEILSAVMRDIRIIQPKLGDTHPNHATINRYPALFTRYAANEHGNRPTDDSGVAGLHLAGDWTKADWSVWMMERGVVSGLRAANAVLGRRSLPPVSIVRLPPENVFLRLTRAIARSLRTMRCFRLPSVERGAVGATGAPR